MAIFKIEKGIANFLLEDNNKFQNERQMEDFFEMNLERLLRIKPLARQYSVSGNIDRIDILGIDLDNSPVIIELKLDKGDDSILQGKDYYTWLLNNKNHFEHLAENKLGRGIKVIWELPKVILIAKRFSPRAYRATESDEYIELVTYQCYKPDLVLLTGEELSARLLHGRVDDSEKGVSRTRRGQVSNVYTIEQHLNIITSEDIRERIRELADRVRALPEIQEDPRQTGVAYKIRNKRGKFLRLEFRPTWIQVLLKKPEYKSDTRGIVRDIISFKWGYGGQVKFTADSNVNYVFEIIKEAYEQTQ